jgi:hypothetical protein
MADTLGNIAVPEIAAAGVFPLVPEWGFGLSVQPQVAIHQFKSANVKIEQRFYLGNGATRHFFQRTDLTQSEINSLKTFYDAHKGSYQPFTYNVPFEDGTFGTVTVVFENEPLSWEHLVGAVAVGITFVEIPTTSPTYTLNSTVTRFPSGALETALLQQVQNCIPLLKIKTKKAGYPEIFVSDRRVTVGAQLYQARVLDWDGISQSINGEADTARFVFGNADRVMEALANDVDLYLATIEFSVFHTSTGIKVDLWKGDLVDFECDEGPEFRVSATDSLAALNLLYPYRTIDRLCWKPYDDGVNCPFATQGALDGAHFPSASGASCDHGFDTANGCLAHGMKRYYGGVFATPQGVRIKTGGTWGKFGRSLVNATSQVAETIYGQPLVQVYTDSDFPVQALLAAGRDESEFYDALGIVCEGPVTFGREHKLDGQFHHGYPGALGLREIPGNDPAGTTDFFSMGQSGNQTAGDWRKVFSGASTYLDNFAAGVAALELRRRDEKEIQLTRLSEHAMEAVVAQGLQRWVWTGAGSRSKQVLTNPVWIAVNMWLDMLRLLNASAATSEQYFDLTAALAAATIASTTVAKLVGAGTEQQFKYRGTVGEQRPLRDWLTDVLNNCLGYWTSSFGKLRIGIRVNATAVEAFTEGNVVYGSLRLSPVKPAFNQLTVEFADEEYEYGNNTVTWRDETRVTRDGRIISANMRLSGTSGKSQAARIATIRGREEVGGVTEDEQKRARQGGWKTTVLALKTEPGMVVSLTHPRVPTGTGKFRILGWRLNKDWSIDLEVKTVADSMYDLLTGPKATDVTASPVPVEFWPSPLRQMWHPNMEVPHPFDPFETTGRTFGLQQAYDTSLSDVKATVIVLGEERVNTVIADTIAPEIGTVTASAGGQFAEGQELWVQVAAYRVPAGTPPGDEFSPPSNLKAIRIPANSSKITVSDITWPPGTWDGYVLGIGKTQATITVHKHNTGMPASIDYDLNLIGSFWNMPNQANRSTRVKGKLVWHGGIVGTQVTSVAAGSITCAEMIGFAETITGRIVQVISDFSDGSAPVWNFSITGFTPGTGQISLTPDPQAAGVDTGDVILILAKNSATDPLQVKDTLFANTLYPAGMTPSEEFGRLVRIIGGTGKGQFRKIIDNDATTLFIDHPFDVALDNTSIFIVEEFGWRYQAESSSGAIRMSGILTRIPMVIENLLKQTLLIGAFGVDSQGMECDEGIALMRMIYIHGRDQLASAGIGPTWVTLTPAGSPLEVTPDLSLGKNFRIPLTAGPVTVKPAIWTGGTIAPGEFITFKPEQDATGGHALDFDPAGYIGLANINQDLTPDTYSRFEFWFNDGSKFELGGNTHGHSLS